MDSGKNVTIYDIAKRAGISASTVGSVMNGTWESRRISKGTADQIKALADEMGYSLNLQASALRKERSKIIGMILPMHDNRYFSSISQAFEEHARKRGLFPVISSTLRNPEIEEEAVRLLLNYQVEKIVCTGATDPDRISELCDKRGVKTYNLDLPGSRSPSVISDNFLGARQLTEALIEKANIKNASSERLLFIGGRSNDHNTMERARGFRDAAETFGITLTEDSIQTCGYAAEKAESVFDEYMASYDQTPDAIFVNSTISLEGIINYFRRTGLEQLSKFSLGCFDWDPFAAMLSPDILMVRQEVEEMISTLFAMMYDGARANETLVQVPTSIVRTY